MATTANPSPPNRLRKPLENHTAWLLRRVWDRVNRRNMHFMMCIVGREGAGKSHTAIKIASAVDPTFTPDRVIFDVAELLRRLKDGDHSPGDFYVLDEAGVQLGRRTWQHRGQVLANQALQLVRSHNLGLIFTLPRLSELDSQTQGRLQCFYEITEKEDGEYVRGKWKWMDPDRADDTGRIYKKYPRRRQGLAVKRITSFAFTPPDPVIVEPYEEAKGAFQEEFYQRAIEELEAEESDEAEEESAHGVNQAVEEILDGRLADVVDTNGTTGKPYISKDLIRHHFEMSHSDARTVKTLVERQIDNLENGSE